MHGFCHSREIGTIAELSSGAGLDIRSWRFGLKTRRQSIECPPMSQLQNGERIHLVDKKGRQYAPDVKKPATPITSVAKPSRTMS